MTEPERRQQLIETAFRGLLAVGLYSAFPAFSDIYRLWMRRAGMVPEEAAPMAFEYPPVAALIWEPIARLPSARWAVVINGLIMVVAAVVITDRIQRWNEEPLSPAPKTWITSPALILLLPMNWDVGVASITILGLAAAVSGQPWRSGAILGAGAAWKVYPAALFLPLVPLFNGARRRLTFLATGAFVIASSYFLYMLSSPDGWRTHLDFAAIRSDFEPTLWGALTATSALFGVDIPVAVINLLSGLALIVALCLASLWVARARPTFAEAAVLTVSLFLIFNKVFKPAYVLWLVPLVALAGTGRRAIRAVEWAAIAHFAVTFFSLWQPIQFGAAVIRTVALVLIVREVLAGVRSRPPVPPRPRLPASGGPWPTPRGPDPT